MIGWIGLGGIGAGMVARLLGAGEDVTVFARGAGLAAARAAGADESDNYAEVARGSDVLALCVYDDAQLADILFDRGALAAMKAGALLIVHTTGAPGVIRRIAAAAPAGVAVVDACFSGGPAEAAAGRLTMMAGATEKALERARPILSLYAAAIHHVGPAGHGRMVKLLNNLLFAANLMNASEIVRLAGRQGLDTAMVARVVAQSSGGSYALGVVGGGADVDALMANIRPYLEKDVAAALSAAGEEGWDMSRFADTAAFFAQAPATHRDSSDQAMA